MGELQKLEQVLVKGDLSILSESERIAYYKKVCESTGLNPLTKPFGYITLNRQLTLYALKGATDQLRKIHNVYLDNKNLIHGHLISNFLNHIFYHYCISYHQQ